MTLTKREKILIEIFVCFILFTGIMVFLLTPAVMRRTELTAEAQDLEAKKLQMESILNNPGIEERLLEQQREAEKYYDYFYSVLNSYTIDGIVNQLMQKNSLDVRRLEISPYEDATYDFPLPGSDVEEGTREDTPQVRENVLVKSVVTLNVGGNYYDILNFMNDLNAKSTCLRLSLVSIEENAGDATGKEAMEAMLRIFIYGVNVKPQGADFDADEAAMRE